MHANATVSSNWRALAPLIKTSKVSKENVNTILREESKTKEELWFEVDEQTLQRSKIEMKVASSTSKKIAIVDLFPKSTSTSHIKEIGKYISVDCEMVGVGPDGTQSSLARVSIVNFHGEVLMDKYVKPIERITDYRTKVSGIEPHHLINAEPLSIVQKEVWNLLQGKILVGHSLKNDFKALLLEHPKRMTRDTSKYRPFRRISRGKTPGLKRLAKEFLGIDIQEGAHDSVDDARVAMLLYRSQKDNWENYLFRNEGKLIKSKKRSKSQK